MGSSANLMFLVVRLESFWLSVEPCEEEELSSTLRGDGMLGGGGELSLPPLQNEFCLNSASIFSLLSRQN